MAANKKSQFSTETKDYEAQNFDKINIKDGVFLFLFRFPSVLICVPRGNSQVNIR